MRFAHPLAWLLVATAPAACGTGGGGSVRAQWTSIDTTLGSGAVSLPMRATWCAARGRLMLLGVAGDTGVGILVRTVKLKPGLFHASDTVVARSPGSTVAFRLANAANLFSLSSDSGAVALTATDDRLAGRFVGWFTRSGGGLVLVTGSFAGIPVAPDSVRCERPVPLPAAAPDSGVNSGR